VRRALEVITTGKNKCRVRELGVAKGTFEPIVAGLKFFYLQTLGYDWPLFAKKKGSSGFSVAG